MLKNFTFGQLSYLLTAFLLFQSYCNSQTRTNLELLYSLTDSLANQIINEIPSGQQKILLTLYLGESYSVFGNNIRSYFTKAGKKILETNGTELNYSRIAIVIETAGIEYGEMFRDGWFGPHFVQRHASISGNYLQSSSDGEKRNFMLEVTDTVNVDEIKLLENESFPFTKGNLPPEPFLSGWAEPLIAIGTAAVIVVIFFSVRSK